MYFIEVVGVLQQESICSVAANGQSARMQHSASFALAKATVTQSPVFSRRIANPRSMPVGFNRRIAYIRWTQNPREVKSCTSDGKSLGFMDAHSAPDSSRESRSA